MTDEQFIPETSETPEPAPKPKRTRRSTKKPAVTEAVEASPAASSAPSVPDAVATPSIEAAAAEGSAEETAAPPKPRRPRRKTPAKAKKSAPEETPETVTPPDQPATPDQTAAPTDEVVAELPPTAVPEKISPAAARENTSSEEHSALLMIAESDTPHAEPVVVSTPEIMTAAPTPSSDAAPVESPTQETPAVPAQERAADTEDEQENTAAAEAGTESAESEVEDESGGTAPRKGRRGRRGGRGRGKSRPQKATEAAADGMHDIDEAEITVPASETHRPLTEENAPETETAVPTDAKTGKNRSAKNIKAEPAKESAKAGRRKMFISVVPGEQVEVALVEEGAIHEYYLEMLHQAKTKGNIYKGVIHNIDTNLQAAFVSYGTGKNGFLQIDEIHPEYFLTHHEPVKGKKFPPIQKVLKAGQEVLVQVVKEPTGNKGAFLTTWLSLAGRFLVLTPGQEQIGVSRKVENDEERARLREMMNGIDPGEGLGVIVRTVSAGTSKTTLKNDLQYLKRLWKDIRKRGTSEAAPTLIYQEPGLAERAVRDYLTDDVCEVWVDNVEVAESIRETVSLLFPRKEDLVKIHADVRQTLWERFNIQRQLEQIYSREVLLPSGGRLVFDQTEALMAIDINSGKISGKGNFEAMALKTNLEAAETIARQLKLRDIGGQVVIDFIEMRDKNHIREVEKMLRNTMKNDRARHDVARMSSFGLLEVVRQRTGSSALAITMEPCPTCGGTGMRRNMEWQSLQALRDIDRQARSCGGGKCAYEACTELGMYLLNHKRDRLREMELQHHVAIEISIRP